MASPKSRLKLIRGLDAVPVGATLFTDLDENDFDTLESQWGRSRDAHAEHGHWDWTNKSGELLLPSRKAMAVEVEEEFQAVMLLVVAGRFSRGPDSGAPVVYVDFVEVAPWNIRGDTTPGRYIGVGTHMIREAARLSVELGFQGRVGLHSLPQSIGFYRHRCGMNLLGPDESYYDLDYLELAAEPAAELISERGELGA